MNERCAIAFARPLARADETMDPAYWRGLRVGSLRLSSIVTLNK